VAQSGLAAWFAGLFPLDGVPLFGVVILFSFIIVIVSNFMSNTAATNIILPLIVAFALHLGAGDSRLAVIAVAMSASFAMCLPVSTPPNAIVYASGRIDAKDFLLIGGVTAVLGPLVVIGWMEFY
jgi:sodium-dependent dicarboxylate transporter 2/3/5